MSFSILNPPSFHSFPLVYHSIPLSFSRANHSSLLSSASHKKKGGVGREGEQGRRRGVRGGERKITAGGDEPSDIEGSPNSKMKNERRVGNQTHTVRGEDSVG